MIRFAITRVVSGFKKLPMATSCGAVEQVTYSIKRSAGAQKEII